MEKFKVPDGKITFRVKDAVLIKGDPGASTYEIWLAEGNVGTEAEFLASLKGEPGDGYVLTEDDKAEIAGDAAGKAAEEVEKTAVKVTPQELTDAQKVQVRENIGLTAEVWSFALEDGTTVDKKVVLA